MTKRGLGVHRRHAHPVTANEEIPVGRTKFRWHPEELRLLARAEARGMSENVKFMNVYLQGQFPDWTLERIKNKRKRPEYRAVLQEIMNDEAARSRDPPTPPAHGPQANEGDPAASLRAWIEGIIPKLASERRFHAASLASICRAALEGEDCTDSLSEWIKAVFPQRARAKRHIPDRKIRDSSPCRSRKFRKAYGICEAPEAVFKQPQSGSSVGP
jgi:hypothetical protein